MPNTSEGQCGPAEPAGLARDVRRASSAELQLPWTCPVTHSREKFYTVCSDYALLNQAASVFRPPEPARGQKKQDNGQPGGAPGGSDEDLDMDVSSGTAKPVLAWEIDKADFNSIPNRKIRTGEAQSGSHPHILTSQHPCSCCQAT